MNSLPLVIFDCDGVLVDSERLVQDIDMRMIGGLGWNITRQEILEQHLGRSEDAVMANIARRIGRPVPEDFPQCRRSAYEQDFKDHLKEVSGVRQAVQELHGVGHDTCVASSGSHATMRLTLGKTGLRTLFEGRIFSADEVAHGKPAPDLFLHAAEQMGYRPERCVVVEDSPSGVAAALSAGMAVVGYSALTPEVAYTSVGSVGLTHLRLGLLLALVLLEDVFDFFAGLF
ncbi:HAD family hydrolase [Arthrobacter sp. NPDC058192]|uniref:HAD family hydrolase n=1 Tax=Arthrobacter sp. NPDC058192 TaxID=3346372 RepID=UPI0036EBF29B